MSYRSNKIKKLLESKGQKNVVVEWIPLSGPVEMGGYDGGWFASSDELTMEPLGYSIEEAIECIEDGDFEVLNE